MEALTAFRESSLRLSPGERMKSPGPVSFCARAFRALGFAAALHTANGATVNFVDHSIGQGISPYPLRIFRELPRDGESTVATLTISTSRKYQTMGGVGAAFSEIGTLALASLPEGKRQALLSSLFDPARGAGFSMCRLPVGASDFATNAYSYAETPGDLGMKDFTLSRDDQSIIPAVQAALRINPSLKLFASPWSPPWWMKGNGRMDRGSDSNGPNTLLDLPEIMTAYALYFSKYVLTLGERGIPIARVCPQNEMDFSPTYPGCVVPPDQMTRFVTHYLAPLFRREGITAEIWPGTFREMRGKNGKPDIRWAAECMKDAEFRRMISGLGIQYSEIPLIREIGRLYPGTRFMWTEAACNDGKNEPNQAVKRMREMMAAFDAGCDSYAYWNMILDENQKSGWNWKQNSLVTIDRKSGEVLYNPDFQPLFLVSNLLRPGDVRIDASFEGDPTGAILPIACAFLRPDGSVTVFVQHLAPVNQALDIVLDGIRQRILLPAHADCGIMFTPGG